MDILVHSLMCSGKEFQREGGSYGECSIVGLQSTNESEEEAEAHFDAKMLHLVEAGATVWRAKHVIVYSFSGEQHN